MEEPNLRSNVTKLVLYEYGYGLQVHTFRDVQA